MSYHAEVWVGSEDNVVWMCEHEHKTARAARACSSKKLDEMDPRRDARTEDDGLTCQ